MFVALLFVPRHAPVDLFETKKKRNHINVYVLVDDWSEFIPERLIFVEGVVVSDTVSLDISQGTRRQSKIVRVTKRTSVKKCIDRFADMFVKSSDDYKKFYEHFQPMHKTRKLISMLDVEI